jgi:phosphoribosylaminoimidazole-succinocarboxamide synthase
VERTDEEKNQLTTTMNTITTTNFNFPNQKSVYRGKVREVYNINEELLVMVATDRLSAFDVVLPKGIPYKGQILNQIATKFMELTQDIVPNWLLATPDPNVAVGYLCEPFKVEMVIRGYVSGHAAREYALGKRKICGVAMAEGLKENDKFPTPIITPTTKADNGEHDADISREDILSKGIVTEADYIVLENYTQALFQRGTEIAASRGLILVDTKYEFGKTKEAKIVLIDEIHTPDSSRYFYSEGYQERQDRGEEQKQLSKEFVRRWLIENGFQGLEGQKIPEMTDEYIETVSERYIELYEKILGEKFVKADVTNIYERIEKNVLTYLKRK